MCKREGRGGGGKFLGENHEEGQRPALLLLVLAIITRCLRDYMSLCYAVLCLLSSWRQPEKYASL